MIRSTLNFNAARICFACGLIQLDILASHELKTIDVLSHGFWKLPNEGGLGRPGYKTWSTVKHGLGLHQNMMGMPGGRLDCQLQGSFKQQVVNDCDGL